MLTTKLFKYIPVNEAVNRVLKVLDHITLKTEEVHIKSALGRVLAEEIRVKEDIPLHNASHFDGYAVDYRDTITASPKNPLKLSIKGEIYPGEDHDLNIGAGEVFYVGTGAYLPKNANAVIPVESAKVIGSNMIEIRHPAKYGDHVVWKGSDFKAGEMVFRPGHILRPPDLGLLAQLGYHKVKVYGKPKVSIISVGDELVSRAILDKSVIIEGLLREYNCIPIDLGVAGDDVNEIRELIIKSAHSSSLIITIGGCSVGKKDLVPDAILSIENSQIVVRGLKRVPGRQTSFAVALGKPILMLPGLIQSMIIGFYSLGVPVIAKLLGAHLKSFHHIIKVRISRSIELNRMKPFERIVFGKIVDYMDHPIVKPLPGISMHINPVVRSDGFIIIPPMKVSVSPGELLSFHLFKSII